jgi:CheY-like chemotaxis protein
MSEMKILVLNDQEEEFSLIKERHTECEVTFAQRYLLFLQEIENKLWDVIYIDDDLSGYPTHDTWTDGNGYQRKFDGVHAARAIAALNDIKLCPTKSVVITAKNVESSQQMLRILKQSNVPVSRLVLEKFEVHD